MHCAFINYTVPRLCSTYAVRTTADFQATVEGTLGRVDGVKGMTWETVAVLLSGRQLQGWKGEEPSIILDKIRY